MKVEFLDSNLARLVSYRSYDRNQVDASKVTSKFSNDSSGDRRTRHVQRHVRQHALTPFEGLARVKLLFLNLGASARSNHVIQPAP